MEQHEEHTYFSDIRGEPHVLSQSELQGHLQAERESLINLAESYGHEARQFLITINAAGIAGVLTFVSAIQDPAYQVSTFAWGSLAFFCTGVVSMGFVLAINVLSVRRHVEYLGLLHRRFFRGRLGGISLARFDELEDRSRAKLQRSSARADMFAYGACVFALIGIGTLIYAVLLQAHGVVGQ